MTKFNKKPSLAIPVTIAVLSGGGRLLRAEKDLSRLNTRVVRVVQASVRSNGRGVACFLRGCEPHVDCCRGLRARRGPTGKSGTDSWLKVRRGDSIAPLSLVRTQSGAARR